MRRLLPLVAVGAACALLSALAEGVLIPGVSLPRSLLYPVRILTLAGINIILAVSLNLITGFTGQFSIGHAGFMAVGAYTSAYLTVYHAQAWERSLAGMVGASLAHALIFLLAIVVGSLVAALA